MNFAKKIFIMKKMLYENPADKIIEVLELLKYIGFKQVDDDFVGSSPFDELTEEIKNCKKCNLCKNLSLIHI